MSASSDVEITTQSERESRLFYESTQNFNAITSWLHSLRFKNILNVFDEMERELKRTIKVIDIGCSYAKLFRILNERYAIQYTGIETNVSLIDAARERYGEHENFNVVHGSAANLDVLGQAEAPDVIVALETLEHIPEHDVVRIVENVAAISPLRFVCSVPIEIGPAVWLKNVGSFLTGYSRHTEYRWSETFWAGLYRLDKVPAHDIGHKGFDWRWLAQTIRHNMAIKETRRFPFRFLPAAVCTSVFFIAAPRT
jgi:SAM-dependent methyltransferase